MVISGDRQVDIQGTTVAVQTMQEPYNGDISVTNSVATNGGNLEVSLNISELGIESSFIFSGVIRNSSYTTIDKSDSSITVNK